MRGPLALRIIILAVACSLGGAACSGPGLPAVFAPSSCAAGGDRCAALSCPMGTHCALTSNCTAFCEQEQLTNH